MSDKNWKREERVVSKLLCGRRKLMKGTDEKEDVEHELFCVDVKLRKTWRLEKWYEELKAYSQKSNKIPLLVVRKPQRHARLAVVDFDFLVSLMKGAGLLD